MESSDDDLKSFEAHGVAPLPVQAIKATWNTTVLESGTRRTGPGLPLYVTPDGSPVDPELTRDAALGPTLLM